MKQNNLAKKLTTWVVIIAAVLAVPFIAGFPWTSYDYIFAGVVLAVLAAIYETVTRNMKDFKQKLIVAAVLLGVIVLILGWAATGPDSEALMNQVSQIFMKKSKTIALPNNSFARILGIPAAILAIPFAAMLLGGLNWDETDFIAVGIILIVAVGLLELAMKVKGKARVYTVAAIILGALWLYVELAVGLFTNWGS